ncbi:MAG: hypothetical protein Q9165_000698 [Trypethelium subeluteriae]
MTRRRADVLKPVDELALLNVHGPTVTGSDGEQGRLYRAVTTGCFGQHMFKGAWEMGVEKANMLARRLVSTPECPGRVKRELELVTFAVVSEVCLGIGVSQDGDMMLKRHRPHTGSMSYWESFAVSADYMGVTYLTPKPVLKWSPFKIHSIASTSNSEWLGYMEDMIEEKRLEREAGVIPKDANLLDSLYSANLDPKVKLEYEAVLGNIWVFVLGGFHTSANTLHFILILLAMHPSIQRTLQQSIDAVSRERNPSAWSHSGDFPSFLNSHHRAIIPPHTLVLANTSAVHRNPAHWPQDEAITEGHPEQLAALGWNPWQWLKGNQTSKTGMVSDDTELKSLLMSGWQPGTYVPFSDGARACIGKRFAQTELCAVLATLMKDCSVELSVDGGKEEWMDARREASLKLSQQVGITLALELKAHVPLNFVERGGEKWFDVGI